MKKIFSAYLLLAALLGSAGCTRSEPEPVSQPSQRSSGLSVEEARAFYEDNALRLTRADESAPGVFAVGSLVPDWEKTALSADRRLECVDVAALSDSEFHILRRRADGSMYEVRAYGKLLICRAADTDSLAAYMRYVVPDEIYTELL